MRAIAFLVAGLFYALRVAHAQLIETERQAEYHKRNNTWPPRAYVPETPGWRKLMEERFAQVDEMEDSGRRYEAFIQTISAAVLAPNFTAVRNYAFFSVVCVYSDRME